MLSNPRWRPTERHEPNATYVQTTRRQQAGTEGRLKHRTTLIKIWLLRCFQYRSPVRPVSHAAADRGGHKAIGLPVRRTECSNSHHVQLGTLSDDKNALFGLSTEWKESLSIILRHFTPQFPHLTAVPSATPRYLNGRNITFRERINVK